MFAVEVVRVSGPVRWAIKAVVNNLFWHPRYRGYHYKKEAIAGLGEWEAYRQNAIRDDIFCSREFQHNFNTAEELGISEVASLQG